MMKDGEGMYWCSETSGVPGGSTLEDMNQKNSFKGFDFSSVWAIEEGKSTPYLQGMKIPNEAYEVFEEYALFEGKGTSAEPYLIHNVKELKRLKYDNGKRYYYKLANDIDLGAEGSWTPIGTEEYPFTGNLDGNGYTIKNMKIEGTVTTALGYHVGLFGFTSKASISNLVLENYTITGAYQDSIGGLVGYAGGGRISKVYTKGNISLSNTVEAWNVGGLAGAVEYDGSTTITQCYTEGSINVPNGGKAGGLIGWTIGGDRRVSVENSYSNAQVTANDGAGGLIGGAKLTNIYYCYAVGKVKTVGEVVGGLVGDIDTSTATSSYWSAELTGQLRSALGMNTATSNLTKQEVYSGWNFSTIWAIEEGQSFAYLQGMLIPDMVYDNVKQHGTVEGTGTTAKPYIITTAEELNKVRYDLKGNYKLGKDIDLSSIAKWTPIGTEVDPFTGTFDGAGYTISNMKIQGSTTENLGTDIGLFGWIDRATIKNVALENYNITGGSAERVGGLVGYGLAPAITNVYTNGTINLAYNRVESNLIGGLIGHVESSDGASAQITQCYAGGSITTQVGDGVGGLVGGAQGTAKRVSITNSYSTANVNGNSTNGVGGLVGSVTTVTIENSYTIGKVQGKGNYVGGLVGYENDGKAYNSYWSEELTTQAESALGIKLTASKLTQQGGYSSWNFTTIWAIENGTSFAYLQGMKIPDAVTQIVKDNTVMTGLGTAASPYIITSKEHLNMIKYDMTGYYKLGNDIDLGSITRWTPIGTEEVPFTGNFNGDGHTIENLKIDVGSKSSLGDNVGLFGYTNGGTIQNVTLDNYKLNGGYGNNIGALVGYARGTAIMKVNTKGSIYLGYSRVNSENIGGLVGYIETSMTISQCHTEGSISAYSAGYQVGGLVGWAGGTVTIQNSYSTAEVSGYDSVGGIMGWATRGYINYCYATGKVTARGENVGGLLGGRDSGSASSSYWDITTTGTEQGVIGTGRDTATIQTVSNYSGWSTTIWNLVEGSYPTLK